MKRDDLIFDIIEKEHPFMGKRSYTAFRFRLKRTAKKKNHLKNRKSTSSA